LIDLFHPSLLRRTNECFRGCCPQDGTNQANAVIELSFVSDRPIAPGQPEIEGEPVAISLWQPARESDSFFEKPAV
jgi:hypothetical protein